MPIWTVSTTQHDDERIEADLLTTEGGALVALSEEGILLRAWAPGEWRTVGHITGVEAHPAGKSQPNGGRSQQNGSVVIGLPRR
jgi:hypothetical protein